MTFLYFFGIFIISNISSIFNSINQQIFAKKMAFCILTDDLSLMRYFPFIIY